MDAANAAASAINDGIRYLKENAWPIALLLGLWFFVRPKVVEALEHAQSARSPDKIKDYDQDLRRVRQMQQLQAEQEAKAKAEELKRKKAALPQEQQKKKEDQARPAKPIKKTTAASSSAAALSMKQFTSTPSYRPARRTIARRG